MMRVETAPYAVQTVTKAFIEQKSPVSTALSLVKTLPSMSISTADTSGMQGGTIQSRSLTDADMALMVDGAPASAASFLAQNIDSENLASVSVTPGTSPIDLPSTTAAAGVLNETSIDAGSKFGGMMDFSYGTNNLSREFLRLESGKIGNTGLRGYISFSNTYARSWMGAGQNQRRHLDFGLRKDWDNGSFARLFLSWNNTEWVVDRYPTDTQFFRYKDTGQGYGHTAEFDPKNNDYWRNYRNYWNQLFINAPFHFVLSKKLQFDIQPYYSWGLGWNGAAGGLAAGNTTYANGKTIPAGTPLTTYFQGVGALNVGATAKIGYDITKTNHLEFGYWYVNQDYTQHFPRSVTQADGSAASPNNADYQVYQNGQRFFPGNTAGYEIHSLFIEDRAKFLRNKLQVSAGFKYVMSNVWYITYPNRNRMGQNLTAPLPHLSFSYRINEHHQFYLNGEGDFRQPASSSLANTPITGSLPKNQYSIKEELGYRYNDSHIVVDLDLFNYNITNRLLSTYVGNNVYGVINAGNQTARGFDIMASLQPIYGFSPYVSFEYLNARLDTNIAASDSQGNLSAFRTKGTQAPLSPRILSNFGLTYTAGGFFSNATLHYTGPQSVTIAGDQRMPGYVTNTLSLGYHFHPIWRAQSPTLRLNFGNLTGAVIRTGVVGVRDRATAVRLLNGNMSTAGSSAQFFVEPRFNMTGTLSTTF
ncbi:TonB-dependent receptor [Neokomagataea tanensis]|uniref:TonB-dependent receptor n=2 Tax=Neokomagataea TaxID=1223423 RepID=A0A4Y6VA12_9PROT|nr:MULTISPECIES: TonB-dependent receptor [Neokomagataea]QDH25768.1 TonB-dependent receptor [Neokomagataea tanensis]